MATKFFTHAHWLHWRSYVIGIGGLALLAAILLFRLGQPALLSAGELQAASYNLSLHNIVVMPLSAPFSLLQWALLKIEISPETARLPAVFGALGATALFYCLIRRWHGRRIALIATWLFGTSGWLLHVGRLAEPQILFLLTPLALLALSSWLNTTKRHGLALPLMTGVYGCLLFIPGAVWFELAALVLTQGAWRPHVKAAGAAFWAGAGLILAACLGFLAYSLITSPALVRHWLGVLNTVPAPIQFLSQWGHSISFMFARGPYAPELWLAHTPVFTAFCAVMCLLGFYVYSTHFNNLRAHLLAAFVLIGSLLAGLNGVQGQSFLVPTLYILVAAGIAYLLHKWYVIFPRNPLGHGFGTLAVAVAVLCVSGYNMAAYYVAWQKSPNTRQTFTHRLL